MSKNIVVVGSLNMDLVLSIDKVPKIGETIHGEQMHYMMGGKGANQAVGCARLNNKVTLLGALGSDTFSEKIINHLQMENLNINYIERIDYAFTGIATILKTNTDNSIIVIPGANEHFTASYLKKYEEIISQADVLITQLETPLQTVHQALKIAKKHNVRTILNPAPAKVLTKEILSLVDYLTPNETEFEYICGQDITNDAQLKQAMIEWKKQNKCELIVTEGSKGCSYVVNNHVVTIPAMKVEVVDTTGAGDTFNAALAHGIARKWEIERIIQFAIKAGGFAVTKLGAQTGMPTLEEITRELNN